jgi:hypothetical protein
MDIFYLYKLCNRINDLSQKYQYCSNIGQYEGRAGKKPPLHLSHYFTTIPTS